MTKYRMRRVAFEGSELVDIPEGSSNIKIEWDPDHDGWVLLFLEPA